jgi:hypothetical protein
MREQRRELALRGGGHPQPNQGLEPTPYSLRSYVAPASRRGSGLALGCQSLCYVTTR